MHEMHVSGEIKTIAFRQGSSGIFTGSIEGLYQGYRFGSTTPDEREYVIEAPNGSIALLLRQQIVTRLPNRPARHPFADGADPFEDYEAGRPLSFFSEGPGAMSAGEPPSGSEGGKLARAAAEAPGMEDGEEIFKKLHYMEVKLHAIPEKSTGIFKGAVGEMEIETPDYRMGGHVMINTRHGDLRLNFLEKGSLSVLKADLWVDGEQSTGVYAGAEGELTFALTVMPPFFGRGPYSGTMRLRETPPAG